MIRKASNRGPEKKRVQRVWWLFWRARLELCVQEFLQEPDAPFEEDDASSEDDPSFSQPPSSQEQREARHSAGDRCLTDQRVPL